MTTKFSKKQARALTTARDQGHAFADVGQRQRARGAYRRMLLRLVDASLLTTAPLRITSKGREALKSGGVA